MFALHSGHPRLLLTAFSCCEVAQCSVRGRLHINNCSSPHVESGRIRRKHRIKPISPGDYCLFNETGSLKWFISGPSHIFIYIYMYVYSTFLSPLQTSHARSLFTILFVSWSLTMYLVILGDLLFRFFDLKASMHVSSL